MMASAPPVPPQDLKSSQNMAWEQQVSTKDYQAYHQVKKCLKALHPSTEKHWKRVATVFSSSLTPVQQKKDQKPGQEKEAFYGSTPHTILL